MSGGSSATKAAVFRAISNSRKSCKRFKAREVVPGNILEDILRTALRAPSGFNLQPTQIILVEDQDVKETIASRAMLGVGNQCRTRDCSALAVFCSDLEVTKRVPRILSLEKDGHRHPNYRALLPLTTQLVLGEGHAATWIKQLATSLLSNQQSDQQSRPMPSIDPIQSWSYKNTSLLVQSFVLAATSHDVATTIMEGIDMRRLSVILRIPDRYAIPMVVAVGYEDKDESTVDAHQVTYASSENRFTPRLSLTEVVFQESFGMPWKVRTT